MSFAEEYARQDSARSILAECSARVGHAIRQEMSKDLPDEERIAGLRLVGQQLNVERRAVQAGDATAITRARFLYGLLLKQVHRIGRHSPQGL